MHFHPMYASLRITHLAYVDDLLLFMRADESIIKVIVDCLVDFRQRAGLLPNLSKSNLYMARVSDHTIAWLHEIMRFQCGMFQFLYVSIPLTMERLRTSNYGPLIEAIMHKLASWPKQTLSYIANSNW